LKVAHLTSVHPRYDTRISKFLASTAKRYRTYLICADGIGDFFSENLTIFSFNKYKSRIFRMWFSCNKIYEKALSLNADLYQIHDPELIRVGLKLIKLKKKVIFDSHENVSSQILDKYYIPYIFRSLISNTYKLYEKFTLKNFSGLIGATLNIKSYLINININTININNYPLILSSKLSHKKKITSKFHICYIGAITRTRGIFNLIKSLEFTKNEVTLNLAGEFYPISLKKKLKKIPGWKKVNYVGFVNKDIFLSSKNYSAGLLNLLHTPNHQNSMPNKLFEYMSYKIPVIASNFPIWKKIIKKNSCGLICNENSPRDIASKIDYLINNSKEAKKMGESGYRAVLHKYNWKLEEKKILSFYKKLI
jgi:glycosyltransferase involved in cell wall biosynthesis